MCSREINRNTQYNMREWLSGGAPPCQGGGRGFDPRLALFKITKGLPNGKSFFVIREVRGTSRNPTASQFGFDFSEH